MRNIASTICLTVKRLGWSQTLLWSFASLGRRFSTHIFVVGTHPHPFEDGEADHDANAESLEGRLLTCDDVVQFFDRTEGDSYSRSFAIDYNAHTDADHRGRGLHRIGRELSARFFAQEGYRAFTAYMEAHNLAPQIAARRMGEHLVGFVALYRSADRVRFFAKRGCRGVAFRIQRRRATPSLRWAADKDRRAS